MLVFLNKVLVTHALGALETGLPGR
jgi:hypothetical protein